MKQNKKLYIGILIGIVLTLPLSIYGATTLFSADEVSYDNSSSGGSSTNVKGSLDELYKKANTYSDYVTETELKSAGYTTSHSRLKTKKQYRINNLVTDTSILGNVSHSCSATGSCNKGTCITSSTFSERYINSVIGSCHFVNNSALKTDSVNCSIQGYSTNGSWYTLVSKSGTRYPSSSITLSLSSSITNYSDKQFTQLRLCWSMTDENRITMSGSVNQSQYLGSYGNWMDCNDTCASDTSTTRVEIRTVYSYPLY